MGRRRKGRLELRFLGPGPRGKAERDDGRSAEFDGWTELGRAIHDLAGDDIGSEPGNEPREQPQGDRS